jgi:hypothetical protein
MPGFHGMTEEALVSQVHQLRLQALQGSAWAAALAQDYEVELRHRRRRPVEPVTNAPVAPEGPAVPTRARSLVDGTPVQGRLASATEEPALRGDATADAVTEAISSLLGDLRVLLGMDIALVAEFLEGHRVFRHVDVDPSRPPRLEVGQSMPLEHTYCQRVIDGRLPPVMSDTSAFPETHDLAATQALGIGAYLSTPVVLASGEVYGTLCCISHQARSALGSRQVDALRSAAVLVSAEIEKSRPGPRDAVA